MVRLSNRYFIIVRHFTASHQLIIIGNAPYTRHRHRHHRLIHWYIEITVACYWLSSCSVWQPQWPLQYHQSPPWPPPPPLISSSSNRDRPKRRRSSVSSSPRVTWSAPYCSCNPTMPGVKPVSSVVSFPTVTFVHPSAALSRRSSSRRKWSSHRHLLLDLIWFD